MIFFQKVATTVFYTPFGLSKQNALRILWFFSENVDIPMNYLGVALSNILNDRSAL